MKICSICFAFYSITLAIVNAQLISDDFELRGSSALLDPLAGQTTQVGGETYAAFSSSFRFGSVGSEGVATPIAGSVNASNSFSISSMPDSGSVSFNATVNFNENNLSGLAGAWVGFVGSDVGLMNNIGSKTDHVSLRFMPVGGAVGQINLQTNVGSTKSDAYSVSGDALDVVKDRDYFFSMNYDFDTRVVTGTVVDSVTSEFTSVSLTLSADPTLNSGQFDFTGLSSSDALSELPYFKSIAVVPESSAYALISGVLTLAFVSCRRKRKCK